MLNILRVDKLYYSHPNENNIWILIVYYQVTVLIPLISAAQRPCSRPWIQCLESAAEICRSEKENWWVNAKFLWLSDGFLICFHSGSLNNGSWQHTKSVFISIFVSYLIILRNLGEIWNKIHTLTGKKSSIFVVVAVSPNWLSLLMAWWGTWWT